MNAVRTEFVVASVYKAIDKSVWWLCVCVFLVAFFLSLSLSPTPPSLSWCCCYCPCCFVLFCCLFTYNAGANKYCHFNVLIAYSLRLGNFKSELFVWSCSKPERDSSVQHSQTATTIRIITAGRIKSSVRGNQTRERWSCVFFFDFVVVVVFVLPGVGCVYKEYFDVGFVL